jgi:hypothetical protein
VFWYGTGRVHITKHDVAEAIQACIHDACLRSCYQMFGAHLSPGMHKYVYVAIYPFFPCNTTPFKDKIKYGT